MTNQPPIVLDVSEMQAPKPMELVLEAMENLQDSQYIKMIHRMQPHPLYNILLDNGYRYKVDNANGLFNIFIWKASDKTAEASVKAQLTG